MAHTVLFLVTVNFVFGLLVGLYFCFVVDSILLLFSSFSCANRNYCRDDFTTELEFRFILSVLKNRKKKGKLTSAFSELRISLLGGMYMMCL